MGYQIISHETNVDKSSSEATLCGQISLIINFLDRISMFGCHFGMHPSCKVANNDT